MRRAEQISRRLKLRHLNVLTAVVRWGSMAKAAKHLAISQPVVSKAISDLENMLGVRLLDRNPLGIEPTIYGQALLKRSVAIFDDLRASVSEIEFLADPTAGELRIGTTEAIGGGLLPALIDRLSRRYPRIAFEVVFGDPATLLDRELRGRRVDLIIGRLAIPVSADDLEVAVLYNDRLHVVAGVQSRWARRRKIVLADLVDERWCLPPPSFPVASLIVDAFHRSGLQTPQRIMTVGSIMFTSNLIATGLFLGVLGAIVLEFNVRHLPLKTLPVELPISTTPITIVTLKGRTLNPVAQPFIDAAREILKPLASGNARGGGHNNDVVG